MKRILSAIIVLTLMLSIMPLSVFAATDAVVYTEVSASKVYPGDTLTYSVSLSGTYDGYSLEFSKKQSGLTITAVTGEAGVYADDLGTSWRLSVMGGLGKVNSAKTKLATVTVSVDANADPGTKEIGFTNIAVSNDTGDRATYATELANVNVISKIAGVQTVAVTPPVKGAVPQTVIAAGSGYTATITWEGNPAKFAADTVYTANITLTAADYYVFASDATGAVSGGTVTGNSVSSDGSTLSFKVTFPKTADKDAPTCIAPANLTATYGQKLSDIDVANPTGNTDGTWTWAAPATLVGNVGNNTFKATFTPTDTDNYATVEDIDITITVNPKPITVTIADISDQQYTGSQIQPTVTVTGDNKTLVLNTDYTVEYGTNKNVGTNGGSATVKAKSGSNYTFSNTTKNFNIVAQAGTVTISGDLNVMYPNAVPDVTIDKHGSDGSVTVYYYTDEACTTGKTATKPTSAGDYWAKAEMTAGTNYGSAVSNVLAFTIERAKIIPVVSISGWTYGDTANTPSVSNNPGNGTVTYQYKLKEAEDSTYSAAVPTDAGTYTVRANVAQSTNYNGGSATADFQITAKDISGVVIDEITDQKYTGNEIIPKPAVKDGSVQLIPDTDFTYSYENNINTGNATVKTVGKGNYSGTASRNFTIFRADISVTVHVIGWTVGGTPNVPAVTGNLGNGEVTYLYKVKDAGDDTYSKTVPTAAGNYTVKATVAQTDNYNGATATADFVISTKSAQIISAESATVSYGDTNQSILGTSDGDGTIRYAVKNGFDIVEIDNVTGLLTIKKAGTATITVTASETDSYAAAAKDVTVTVNPMKVAVPAEDTTDYVYNGAEQTYKIAANDVYTVTGDKQTLANESGYIVTVTLNDTVNYQWSDGSVDAQIYSFIIRKATITIAAVDKNVYIGETVPVLGEDDYTVTGLADGETLKTKPTIAYETTPDMSRAGTVKILVSGAVVPDGGNYHDIVYNSGTLTITQKSSGNVVFPTYYSIALKKTEGGSVTVSQSSAIASSKITLTIVADEGYAVETVKVVDVDGKDITVSGDSYAFRMPASSVTVTVIFKKVETPVEPEPLDPTPGASSFADVEMSAYYFEAVAWALKNGITTGTSDTTFEPDMICTRAQAVTFLWRAAGSPTPESREMPFEDVAMGAYYYDAVLWAVENGITNGTSATQFSPDENCTRAQIITFLWRAQKSPEVNIANPFDDVAEESYYLDAVLWAVEKMVTNGTSISTFGPNEDCTRAQIVTFMYRALTNIEG